MKTILIPVDFSDHSTPTYKFTIKIAGQTTPTQLVFLHSYSDQVMLPDSGMNMGFDNDSYLNMELIEEFKQLANSGMQKLKTEVEKYLAENKLTNFEIKTIVEAGDTSWEISSICKSIIPNYIVMGTQGTGKKGILEGSMAKKIMTKVSVPVIAVPTILPLNDAPKQEILYASNGNEKDFSKITLLYKLFENLQVSIHVIHLQIDKRNTDYIDHVSNLKEAFAEKLKSNNISFTLMEADNKNNALSTFVKNNNINSIAFIAHKSNIFHSLFRHKLSKNDFFKLGLPMIALHE